MKLDRNKSRINLIKEIYAIWLPAIIAQALMSFMTYEINIILVQVNEALVTALDIKKCINTVAKVY